MTKVGSKPNVLWSQVMALAGVQGAITLLWVIYGVYIAKLLTNFGLPESWASALLIAENALGVVMEPVMGGLSDQAQRYLGTRFPFISIGVILASALFIAIPTIVVLGRPTVVLQWILLATIMLWALAMTVFRSPALCLLGQYAFATNLPQAASILSFVGGMAGALRPLASGVLLSWGPALTFTIGSLTLLGAATVLRSTHPPAPLIQPASQPTPRAPSLIPLMLLSLVGFTTAWGVRLLMGELLPRAIQLYLPAANLKIVMGLIAVLLALLSIPAGILATRRSNASMMTVGALGTGGLILVLQSHGLLFAGIVVFLLLVLLSLVLNGALPLAFSVVPPTRGGLAVGMYFGGFSAAMSLFGYLLPQPHQLELPVAVLMSSIMFWVAGAAIAWVSRSSILQPGG